MDHFLYQLFQMAYIKHHPEFMLIFIETTR
jgi:hypothetical protein